MRQNFISMWDKGQKKKKGQKYSPVKPVVFSVRSKVHTRCLFSMNVRDLEGQQGNLGTISFIPVSQ